MALVNRPFDETSPVVLACCGCACGDACLDASGLVSVAAWRGIMLTQFSPCSFSRAALQSRTDLSTGARFR